VAIQLSVLESYLPPVLKRVPPLATPPQMIISLPVQTPVWYARPLGAFIVVVAVQLFETGLYLPPVFE
jgi:hypothetical protein